MAKKKKEKEEEEIQPPFELGDMVETAMGQGRVYGRSLQEPFVVDLKIRVPAHEVKKVEDD